jgi:glycine oxidase
MLSPLGEAAHGADFLSLATTSFERFDAFARLLVDSTGIDVEYRTHGKLHVSLEPDDDATLERMVAAGGPFGARRVSAAEALELEPALTERVRGAVVVERDHTVNNRYLGQALWAAATSAGADIRLGVRAAGIVSEAGRFRGVKLADGETLEAAAGVIAAGAWSARLEGLPSALPVRPVRGQMVAVHASMSEVRGGSPLVRRAIESRRCYLIPRDSGRVLIGATIEDVGFRTGPTPAGVAAMLEAGLELVPEIADVPMTEMWAGFRPGTPDRLPILGPAPGLDGLFYACGHFRNGILLAPVTADIIGDLVSGNEPSVAFDAFRAERFGG